MAYSIPWLDTLGTRKLPVVHQSTAAECGLACIAMIAEYVGAPSDLTELRRRAATSLKGATLESLAGICRGIGLDTRALACSVDELEDLVTPCILHWRFNHFVVLRSVGRDHVVIHDPARGVVKEALPQIRRAFTGIALEVSKGTTFEAGSRPRQLRVPDLLPRKSGLVPRFVAGMLLALVCECLLLVSPLYLQTIIDGVLANGDALLLRALLFAFSVLLIFQIAAATMRGLTFQYLAHATVFDMAGRVLNRLLRLPLRYFRSRELGDVQHRFQALSRVQSFIVATGPSMAIDALFLGLLLSLMSSYDPSLTALNIAAAVLWCAWRFTTFRWRLRLAADITAAEATNQTHFLETLRGMTSIKAGGGEGIRAMEWKNHFAATINARIRAGNLRIADSGIRQCLLQGAQVVTVFLLAKRGLGGEFSIGMISAYAAWLAMFSGRLSGLVDGILEYRLLQVPLGRLADIVFTEAEPVGRPDAGARLGDIELRNVTFHYADDEPGIIRNCSATIRAGSFVAIAGASGSGKSTLLHLIAGTELPDSGSIRYDDRKIAAVDRRHALATLFQDDRLLRGSVASNIALFDEEIDYTRVRRAAEQACVAEEIAMLPMGFETRVADLGSALSFGQVQRILLARALYRDSELLLLDEATSGLNPDLEKRVVASLRELTCTRVVVTHSDQVLEAADEVLWLRDGTLVLSPPVLT